VGLLGLGSPVHAPQTCDNTKEYKIEYQSYVQEEKEKEYKAKSGGEVLEAYRDPGLGYNCYEYARSKKDIGSGFGTLGEKVAHIKTKDPAVGAVGVTKEGPVGHLVFVEEVKEETLVISEGNFAHCYITLREVPKSLVLGFL
jgi:surface antigen